MGRLSRLLCSLALACSAAAATVVDRADAHAMEPVVTLRRKLGLATQMANGVVTLLAASGSLHATEGPLSVKKPPAENNSSGLGDTLDPLDTGASRDEGLDEPEEPASDEEMVSSTWCASGFLAHDGVVCCDKTCGQCGGDNCASLPGGAEHCCLAIITSMAVPCSSYTDTACLLPEGAGQSGVRFGREQPEESSSAATATTKPSTAHDQTTAPSGSTVSSLEATIAANRAAAASAMFAAAAVTEGPLSVKKPPAENNSSGLGDTLDPLDTGVGRDEGASDQASNASNATEPTTAEEMVAARAAEVAAAKATSTWCASGFLAHDSVVCCDKTCGQCGGDNCANLPGGAEHCCLAVITSMAIPCSSYTDTACLLPPPRWLAESHISSARAYFGDQ